MLTSNSFCIKQDSLQTRTKKTIPYMTQSLHESESTELVNIKPTDLITEVIIKTCADPSLKYICSLPHAQFAYYS